MDPEIFNYVLTEYCCPRTLKCLVRVSKDLRDILETNSAYLEIKAYKHRPTFITACANGHVYIASWLRTLHKPSTSLYLRGCSTACKHGHINIVKWLYMIDKSVVNNDTYNVAHYHEQVEILNWMDSLGVLSVKKHIIHCNEGYTFSDACYTGDVNKVEQAFTETNRAELHFEFIQACKQGHLNLAKWIYGQEPIATTGFQNLESLEGAMNHLELCEWLFNKYPRFDMVDFIRRNVLSLCPRCSLPVIKLLLKNIRRGKIRDELLARSFEYAMYNKLEVMK